MRIMRRSIIMAAMVLAIALACVLVGCDSVITEDFINTGDLINGPTTVERLPVAASIDDATEYARKIEPTTVDFEREVWSEKNYTVITLADNASEVTTKGDYEGGVSIEGNTINIDSHGFYKLTGKLTDGRVVVAKRDNICIVLDNAEISCSTSAPLLFLKNGLKVLTLASGSENKLVDASTYTKFYDNDGNEVATELENKINGCLYSQHELVINGDGALTIEGKAGNGISGKSKLKIASGTITVSAASNGIKAKAIEIEGGKVTVSKAGNDGIKSIIDTNEEEGAQTPTVTQLTGYVTIVGGVVDVTSTNDGIQAETMLRISGTQTEVSVRAGGGAASTTADLVSSKKGLKASGYLMISGGAISVNSFDDALHGDLGVIVNGGNSLARTAAKGVDSVAYVAICGGRLEIEQSKDGIETQNVQISGATVRVSATSNGIKCEYAQSTTIIVELDCALIISDDAAVDINAGGDAVESDGTVLLSGGSLYIDGPTAAKKAVIKANGGFVVNGGNLLACGSLGMVQDPVTQSTQCTVSFAVNKAIPKGTTVKLCDSFGKVLLTRELVDDCRTVAFSSAQIQIGGAYTVYVGDSVEKSFTVSQKHSLIGANI